MNIYKKLHIKLKGEEKIISFGVAETEEEKNLLFKQRYEVYSNKGYIDESKYSNGLEYDDHDKDGDCVYIYGEVDNKVIGQVRLIIDEVLPTEKSFTFNEPELMKAVPREKRAELGRLIVVPYNKEKKLFFPRGIILLFLITTVVEYSKKNDLLGGYSFVKKTLLSKLNRSKMPLHIIKDFENNFSEDDDLYNYFTQEDNPAIPSYFHIDDFDKYVNKILSRRIMFKRKGSDYFFNNTLYSLFSVLNILKFRK